MRLRLSLLAFILLLLSLAACGDEQTPPTPRLATATPEPPAPFVERTPIIPTATAVTLGRQPETPVPPTPIPTPTASVAQIQNEYVREATTILSGVISSPEVGDAVTASGEAIGWAVFGGSVDVNALATKLDKAAQSVADSGEKLAALDPPPAYKPTHDRLIEVFSRYDRGFTQAQEALNRNDWVQLGSAIQDIAVATDELNTLSKELGGPGY